MAQRTDTDLRELKDLIECLDRKMESLDKKIDRNFIETDKKIDKGFVDVDKKIEALDKKIDLGFQAVEGKIDKLDTRLGIVEAGLLKLDNRLWGFIGIALSVTLGSLLTVFIRFMFSNNPKF